MSSITSLNNDDDLRPRRETRLDGSDAVFGPQHLGNAEHLQRTQEIVKAQDTTMLNATYTGKGSIINDMA